MSIKGVWTLNITKDNALDYILESDDSVETYYTAEEIDAADASDSEGCENEVDAADASDSEGCENEVDAADASDSEGCENEVDAADASDSENCENEIDAADAEDSDDELSAHNILQATISQRQQKYLPRFETDHAGTVDRANLAYADLSDSDDDQFFGHRGRFSTR